MATRIAARCISRRLSSSGICLCKETAAGKVYIKGPKPSKAPSFVKSLCAFSGILYVGAATCVKSDMKVDFCRILLFGAAGSVVYRSKNKIMVAALVGLACIPFIAGSGSSSKIKTKEAEE